MLRQNTNLFFDYKYINLSQFLAMKQYHKNHKPRNYNFGPTELCKSIDELMWMNESQMKSVAISADHFKAGLECAIQLIDVWNDKCKQEMGCKINAMQFLKRGMNYFITRLNKNAVQRNITAYDWGSDQQMMNMIFSCDSKMKMYKHYRILNMIARISTKYLSQATDKNISNYLECISIIIKKQFYYEIFRYAQQIQKRTYVILPWERNTDSTAKQSTNTSSNSVSTCETPTNELATSMFERVISTYCHYNNLNINSIPQSDLDKICAAVEQHDDFNDIMNEIM